MKKVLFSMAAVCLALAGLTSCSDDVTEVSNPVKTKATNLVINGTLSPAKVDAQTRVDFTQGEGNALKAKFEAGDYIRLWFRDADGNSLKQIDLPINESTISSDGRTAQFHSAQVEVPAKYTQIHAILAEKDMAVDMTSSTLIDDLSSQDGSLDDALRHSLFQANKEELAVNDTVYNEDRSTLTLNNIKFENSTSIFKLNIKVKASEGVEITKETPITITSMSSGDSAPAYYNKVAIVWGQPGSDSSRDNTNGTVFTVKPNEVTKNTDNSYNITSYMAVWPVEGNSKEWSYNLTANEIAYMGSLTFVKDIVAGNVYSVPVTMDYTSGSYKHWYNDEARNISLPQAGRTPSTDVDWITYENGQIVLAENTTGKPRKGTLTMTKDEMNADTYEIVQIEVKDFKNAQYQFLSKYCSKNASFPGESSETWSDNGGTWTFTTTNPYTLNVTFGEPRKSETLPNYDGNTYTNNVGIRGLFQSAVLDGTVVIDYDAMTCKLGLFMDTRDDEGTGQEYKYTTTDSEGNETEVTSYVFFTASVSGCQNFRQWWHNGASKQSAGRYNQVWNMTWRLYKWGNYPSLYMLTPTKPGWVGSVINAGATQQVANKRTNNQDYYWIWLTLNDDLDDFIYSWTTSAEDGNHNVSNISGLQEIGFLANSDYTWKRIIGITVGLSTTSGITDDQCNHNFTNIVYAFKPSGYYSSHGGYTEMKRVETTTSASGITGTGYTKK